MALKIVESSKWIHMDGTIETLDELKKVADVLGREVTTETLCTRGVPGTHDAVYTETPCVWAYLDWLGRGPGFVASTAFTIGSHIRSTFRIESEAGRALGLGSQSESAVGTASASD